MIIFAFATTAKQLTSRETTLSVILRRERSEPRRMSGPSASAVALRGSALRAERLRVTGNGIRELIAVGRETMGAFVHMLLCADDSFYVGSATGDDLWKRIAEHQAGAYRGYTSTRLPVQLVWSEHFDRIVDAIAVERKIKGWSRAKKQALIKGDGKTIMQLSKRRAGRNKG
jgi:putative endonuclease